MYLNISSHAAFMNPIRTKSKGLILFFPVKTAEEKIQILTHTAQECFYEKKRLLFLTAGEQASHFLDDLLWKRPPDAFIPHGIYPTHDLTLISIAHILPPSLKIDALFNLTVEPIDIDCAEIFEFEDLTTPEKHALAQKRHAGYLLRQH